MDLDAVRASRPDLMSLRVHNDPRGFVFLYPETWQRFTFDGGNGPGVLFAESPDDFGTHVSVEVLSLDTPVTGDDLAELEKGFLAGLRKVPKSKIESHDTFDAGILVGVEARQLFDEGGTRRKRWVRLLYRGTYQARLVAQGADEAAFERWLVKFEPLMTSFDFGNEAMPTTAG